MTITTFALSIIASILAGTLIEIGKFMISRRINDRLSRDGH